MAINKDLLELAAFKCLCEAPLTTEEALQVGEASMEQLCDVGLSLSEVQFVREWFRRESQRLISQSMMDKNMIAEAARGSIKSKRLREIIAEEIINFENRNS